MGQDFYIDIAKEGIKITLMLASPMLLGALFMGILVSLFQAVTQINEQTLSFIPKIIVIVGALAICAPWMSDVLVHFTEELILNIPNVVLGK
ncbi:MAG: EscS/YscS/HrcS family type III secretion system export apparatus protein [Bdellovibrionales bacterium RIFOXYB1_FULL_37_110]|nr:MAG: EscS/YscS/HrcS family type III secretion system export apparatus protein [Bdellovibrionales bacterium RIFOXYA1_FULL_38_20]OFZ51601.1 MAG: EscS/YscS/HrcS family type III secretion system export apparatus protein [Bdellovibrionales bacterium RIFOXYC1_FULL_37_79]OFZ60428.1 MAG: EscS/YscS/HrcS family type III secretion system export apparatus protein [Bdellovibrionales bacterium RIFOXYB1_FULL_37_110]OFZ65001.1 MAG: EscS/YscS/HrcS family type III secretion system export apparatus protein [Bde